MPTIDEQIAAALAASPVTGNAVDVDMPPDYVGTGLGLSQGVSPVEAALAALHASGSLATPVNPTLYGTGAHDTDLATPDMPPRPTMPPEYGVPATVTGQYDASGHQIHGVQLPDGAVTVRGQQAIPNRRQEAGIQRQYLLDDPSRELAPGDVSGSMYRETKAYNELGAADQKKAVTETLAQREQAAQLGDAYVQSADEMKIADAKYQQARAAIEQKNDLETAAWMQDMQSKAQQEPNPHRWWENQSGLGKALWGLSMVFGAAYSAMTPGAQNAALNMAWQQIQQDVQLQKERLGREMDTLRTKGQVMEKQQLRNLTDASDDHTMMMGRLQALKQAYIARVSAPGAMGMKANLAAADAAFAAKEAELATSRRTANVQIDEARLQREHASYMQSLQLKNQWNMQSRELAKDYDLAALKEQADLDKTKAGAQADMRGIPLNMGVAQYVNGQAQPVQVHKDQFEKAAGVAEVANRRYQDLGIVRDALANNTFVDRMKSGDINLRSAVSELGYTTAKQWDPNARLTDQDVKWAVVGDLGFDPNGNVWEQARFAQNQDKIRSKVEHEMQDMEKRVSKQLGQYVDTNVSGSTPDIRWSPQRLYNPEQATPNMTETLSSPGGFNALAPTQAPANADDFRRKRALESDPSGMFRHHELPSYDESRVQQFEAGVQGISPKFIRKLAEKTLSEFNSNTDPWAGPAMTPGDATARTAIQAAAEDAIKSSETALQAFRTEALRRAGGAGFMDKGALTTEELSQMAEKEFGLHDIPDELKDIEKAVQKKYDETHFIKHGK